MSYFANIEEAQKVGVEIARIASKKRLPVKTPEGFTLSAPVSFACQIAWKKDSGSFWFKFVTFEPGGPFGSQWYLDYEMPDPEEMKRTIWDEPSPYFTTIHRRLPLYRYTYEMGISPLLLYNEEAQVMVAQMLREAAEENITTPPAADADTETETNE